MAEPDVEGGPRIVSDDFQQHTGARRGRRVRRVVILILVGFVVAGAWGAFGYRQRNTTVTTADHVVSLSHPAVTRGGIPARWAIEVRSRHGMPMSRVEIRTTASYFSAFDRNALTPEPAETWQGDDVVWIFRPDSEQSARVSLDLRTQPGARWRYRATTRVRVDDTDVAVFDYSTFVVP